MMVSIVAIPAIILSAWAWVQTRVPEYDSRDVRVLIVHDYEMVNTHHLALNCGEADLVGHAMKILGDERCMNDLYIRQALMHELGHLVSWRDKHDAGEVAADAYVLRYWDYAIPFSWAPMTEEPYR